MKDNFFNRPILLAQEVIHLEFKSSLENEKIEDTLVLRLRGIIEQRGDNCISIDKVCSILRNLDPTISRVIFDFDTPGGSVEGIQELTELIKNIRQTKGIYFIGISNPLCCSGGYWIASACDKIYASSSTARIGSIGVLFVHQDLSKKDEMEGKRVTEIFAGKYKKVDSQHKQLSPEAKAILQAQVDYVYSLFVEEVSSNRNIPIEVAIAEIGDGRVFIGQQAVAVGLADGVKSLSQVLEENSMAEAMKQKAGTMPNQTKAQDEQMEMIPVEQEKIEQLVKENEALKQEISELKKKLDSLSESSQVDEIEKEKELAAIAERNRIRSIEEIAPSSCQALLSKAKSEGWSVEQSAVEFLKASKTRSNNPLRAESTIVPSSMVAMDEQMSLARRMAESVNSKIRS